MYITNNPVVAFLAEKSGVQRIWIDLETLGKQERQRNIDSVKSHHSINDIEKVSQILTTSDILVRVNPINPCSELEINQVISAGADIIMLPMWRTIDEVQTFIHLVNGRVKTTLLLETNEAVECVDQILEMGGFDEIHIGLNDLHLSYGLTFMFQLLANGQVEMLCNKFKKKGIPYGFGGIARLGYGMLVSEKVIMEHYRLGSTRTILSRSFCNVEQCRSLEEVDSLFQVNMKSLREYEKFCASADAQTLRANQFEVAKCVDQIVEKIKVQST